MATSAAPAAAAAAPTDASPDAASGLQAQQVLEYLQRRGLTDVAAAFQLHESGATAAAAPAASSSGTASTAGHTAPTTQQSPPQQQLQSATAGSGLHIEVPTGMGGRRTSGMLKPPAPMQQPASPTPSKPMPPTASRMPPLDADSGGDTDGTASARARSEPSAAAEDDGVELWDARELGVVSVPGSDADLWQLDPHSNLAPAFPRGGALPYKAYVRACEAAPLPQMVATRPYHKQPPPADLPLESFDLRVIYEAGRTGFEDQKDFPIHAGNVIAGRYQVTEYLGSAAFSRAVQCVDLKHQAQVCVKIIRNSKDFFDQALDEIKLLLHINGHGDADANHVLQLYDYFYYKEHVFLVCELLRDNLYEFAKFNRDQEEERYFTLARVRLVAKQVLTALAFVHSLGLMHCDLKPENILIKSYSRCIVKVIDFGSSCYTTDSLSSYVQSRCYRAPEVVLGCPYDGRIDVWSLGAILPELLTGHVLFHNDTLAQMLARIAAICGPYPESMLHSGRHTSCFVTAHGAIYEYPSTEVDGQRTEGELTFHFPRPTTLEHLAGDSDPEYLDFLRQCLTVDPTRRPTAAELLQHPFIRAAADNASDALESSANATPADRPPQTVSSSSEEA